jgi:polyribonucleotide nucleotidyltransferase
MMLLSPYFGNYYKKVKNIMNTTMEKMLDDATQLRDQLLVQANLGKAETKVALEKLEPKLDLLKEKIRKISDVTGDSAEELSIAAEMGFKADSKEELDIALELAADEIKKGYEKIKKLL